MRIEFFSRWKGLSARWLRAVLDSEFDFVGVGFEFGGVHGVGAGGQGAEVAGDLGAQAVGDAVLAAGEAADEEGDALVAEFDVGAEAVAGVAAADVDGLEAGGLHVLEDEVLVVVLALDDELDLDQVAALEVVAEFERARVSYFDLLVDDLAARAGDLDLFVDARRACSSCVRP